MKKWVIVVLVVAGVLLSTVLGLFLWLRTPHDLQEFSEAVPVAQRSTQGDVQTALLAGGIESSLADVTAERAYVAYDLPASASSGDDTQAYVLGVLLDLAKASDKAVIVQYVDEKAVLMWKLDLGDVQAALDSGAAEDAVLGMIERTAF